MDGPLSLVLKFGHTAEMLAALGVGVGFGFVLERGGFGRADNLAAIFYGRDFRVMRVMFTAIVTAMLGVTYLSWLGILDLSLVYLVPTYWVAQVVGGLVGELLLGQQVHADAVLGQPITVAEFADRVVAERLKYRHEEPSHRVLAEIGGDEPQPYRSLRITLVRQRPPRGAQRRGMAMLPFGIAGRDVVMPEFLVDGSAVFGSRDDKGAVPAFQGFGEKAARMADKRPTIVPVELNRVSGCNEIG